MKKRVVSLFVCLCLALTMVSALSLPAYASTNGHTQAEAVAWVNKQVGKYLDYDGAYGAQCWDLIKYYYVYLGNGKYATGNATNFQSNKLPSGWTRVKSGPKPGDVIVWGAGTKGGPGWTVSKYGHVGIVAAVNGDKLTTVEQNINGSPCKKATRSASYATCFIRPDFAGEKILTINLNVNGGRLDSTEYKATAAGIIQKGGVDVTHSWAYGTGNSKYGLANASTLGLVRDGYAFVGWSLSRDGSSTIFDQNDTTVKAETIYPKVKDGSASVTLYAIWTPAEYTLRCYYNDSGKNYLYGSDFSNGVDDSYWQSRNLSVATLSADSSEQHNGYNALKIVNASAGSSGKDLAIQTITQGNQKENSYVGDTKPMTLSFWAKSSKSGTKIFFRWGYESTSAYRSVALTTSWKKYTISMDKTAAYGQWIHPYVDSAGTVWLTELQLEDGAAATDFVPETGGLFASVTQRAQGSYALPETPSRPGYTFDGWYTAANGGNEITASTPVKSGNFAVYAHWAEGHVHSYVAEEKPATCTESGGTVYSCESCGDSYMEDEIPALGHSFVKGVCTRCGEIDEDFVGSIEEPTDSRLPFDDVQAYPAGTFSDIGLGKWYDQNVMSVYRLGMMNGTGAGRFSPGGNVTIAQAVTMAARLHSMYYEDGEEFQNLNGGNWYDPYVDYLKRNGLLPENYDYKRPATREEFAHILAAAFPEEALEAQYAAERPFADKEKITYQADVELLYLAGVISGMESKGQLYFKPGASITRAEAAAIVTRMAKPDLRAS